MSYGKLGEHRPSQTASVQLFYKWLASDAIMAPQDERVVSLMWATWQKAFEIANKQKELTHRGLKFELEIAQREISRPNQILSLETKW